MKKLYLLLFIAFLLISCSFNQTFSNRESDKIDAEKISDKFYWELMYGPNREKTYELFSDKFFEVTNKDKLNDILTVSQNELGPIEEHTLVKWETLVVKGTNPKSEYILVYNVKRSISNTEETLSMQKENGVIKIVGYRVNQNLLK
ncbi:hypothetical protein [Chryseobacterium daecheongense]|uniref:DUF3887 domain-containing protein n=1 Tax=Chryseobacterium daecheongense TaxID=192389 RepID=A0A3N0W7C3_9FLAO|nr:hypothetical protein [Chryseobacterium daecheongense]ROI00681.1 hypothetical protein EGI05_07335 [Chryseobacterium daecheongense]TDX94327.1 hypothetical protein BCF50_0091 [Chryseobacterium daecheongense]